MKQKNSFDTSKKFNKHHHHEEFFLYKSINEKEALCPTCNHPVGRHKIRTPHHCTEKLCNCKLSRRGKNRLFQVVYERKKKSKK